MYYLWRYTLAALWSPATFTTIFNKKVNKGPYILCSKDQEQPAKTKSNQQRVECKLNRPCSKISKDWGKMSLYHHPAKNTQSLVVIKFLSWNLNHHRYYNSRDDRVWSRYKSNWFAGSLPFGNSACSFPKSKNHINHKQYLKYLFFSGISCNPRSN